MVYNSPYDYEKHMLHPVSQKHKNYWINKRSIMMILRDKKRAVARPGFVTVR
jgi:hypothetical protein